MLLLLLAAIKLAKVAKDKVGLLFAGCAGPKGGKNKLALPLCQIGGRGRRPAIKGESRLSQSRVLCSTVISLGGIVETFLRFQ